MRIGGIGIMKIEQSNTATFSYLRYKTIILKQLLESIRTVLRT